MSETAKPLDSDEVRKTVLGHFQGAVVAVGLLTVFLFVLVVVLVICALVGGGCDAAPADLAVSRSLLIGSLLLSLAYVFVLLLRLQPFKEKSSAEVLEGKRKELYEALTPERYIIAGSTLTILFVFAVLCGLPVAEQATTVLVGIAFVTPLGVLLNKWGDLGEYYRK